MQRPPEHPGPKADPMTQCSDPRRAQPENLPTFPQLGGSRARAPRPGAPAQGAVFTWLSAQGTDPRLTAGWQALSSIQPPPGGSCHNRPPCPDSPQGHPMPPEPQDMEGLPRDGHAHLPSDSLQVLGCCLMSSGDTAQPCTESPNLVQQTNTGKHTQTCPEGRQLFSWLGEGGECSQGLRKAMGVSALGA